jgi:hypothetical protein
MKRGIGGGGGGWIGVFLRQEEDRGKPALMRECQVVVLKTMKTCSIPCLDCINPRHSCMKLKKHRKLFGINLCKSLSMMHCIMHPRTHILLL